MKNIFLLLIAFCFVNSVFAQKTPVANGNTAASAKLNSGADSMQYILGAHLGQYISNNGFTISNPSLFKKGLEDAMNGKPLLVNADSVSSLMEHYQKYAIAERNGKNEKLLFEKVKVQAVMGVLPSGVCYTIIKAGTGKRPLLNDTVVIHLKGFFADGKKFEDTYPKNNPYKTTANNVIPGIKEILQIMPVGSLWRVYIPSTLAFGEKGLKDIIPPYSALIYEVELLSVTAMPEGK
jgi:FKBP-type peptidyl-prolyl cis-trans isomerase